MRVSFLHVLFAMLFILILFENGRSQTLLPNSNAVTQNFNGMGATATAALPTNWKMSAAGMGATAKWADASNIAATTQAAQSGAPIAGGAYNWGSSTTDRAIGFMTDANYASPNSIMAFYRNSSNSSISSLIVTFNIERYRVNTNTFSLAFYTSFDGTNWTARTAGDIAPGIFATGISSYTFGSPQVANRTIVIDHINIPVNGDFYLRWVFTNTNSANSQGLGLDNVVVDPTVSNPDLVPTCPYNVILVLDESGSVVGSVNGSNNISPQIRTGATDIVNALNGTNSQIAVVEFNLTGRRASIGGTTAYQTVNASYLPKFNTYINDPNTSADADHYDPEDAPSGQTYTNYESAFIRIQEVNATQVADLVIFITDPRSDEPNAYVNSSGTSVTGSVTTALPEAVGAAEVVKTQGSHIFFVGVENPPPAGVSSIEQLSGPDLLPDVELIFSKSDYTLSAADSLQNILSNLADSVCIVDLQITKTSVQSACPGENIVFTLVVSNKGDNVDSLVVVKDTIPNGYTYVSDNGGASTTMVGSILTWNITTLAGGGTTSLQITVKMNASGNLINTAYASGQQVDVDPTNNQSSFSVSLLQNCDDAIICTNDFCINGICQHIGNCCHSNSDCADQLICTIDSCANGACTNPPFNCDDQNQCTNDNCNSLTGCMHTPNALCNDNDACTMNNCVPATGCVFLPNPPCDDNDACTTNNCVPSTGCLFTPNPPCNDNNACTDDSCIPQSGCQFLTHNCNDGNKCTDDNCNPLGGCQYTTHNCADGNVCTDDSCDPSLGCQYATHDCEDRNACTDNSCNPQLGCQSAAHNCNDGNACTDESCDPALGCLYATHKCTDGNVCNGLETCNSVLGCRPGTPLVCSDGNVCNGTETCNSTQGCIGGNPLNCNDLDACTDDSCNPISGCLHATHNCNDLNACTDDICNPQSGCQYSTHSCNDSNACIDDFCVSSTGCFYLVHNCNDNNFCTDDFCSPQSGCFTFSHNCNDNNVCTRDFCQDNACQSISIGCNDNDACTDDACDPVTDCFFLTHDCNDLNVCTDDFCNLQTGCFYTTHDCNDLNACIDDFCNPQTGCFYTDHYCDDGDFCQDDFCNPQTGCFHTLHICDDINPCTIDDCFNGACRFINVNFSVPIIKQVFSEWCQTSKVKLTANATNLPVTYLWSTGITTPSIITTPGIVTYSVTVTNPAGCKASASVAVPNAPLASYVIIAKKEVNIEGGTVTGGGIGVTDGRGKIKLNHGAQVTAPGTFAQASDIILNSGGTATNKIFSPASVTLSPFEFSPYCTNHTTHHIHVTKNSSVILTGNAYDHVTVEANSRVTFTQTDVHVRELDAKDGSILKFADCTKLHICKTMHLEKGVQFNPDENDVIVYVQEDVHVHKSSKVVADIYSYGGHIHVDGSDATVPTIMKGLFIALSVTDHGYTNWIGNNDCSHRCAAGRPVATKVSDDDASSESNEIENQLAFPENNVMLKAYPNPFSQKLTIEFTLPEDSRVKLEIFNVSGQKLATVFEGNVKAAELQKTEFTPDAVSSGMIIYRLQTQNGTYYDKAVMVR